MTSRSHFYFLFIILLCPIIGLAHFTKKSAVKNYFHGYKIDFSETDSYGDAKCIGSLGGKLITCENNHPVLRVFDNNLNMAQEVDFIKTNQYKSLLKEKGTFFFNRAEIINSKIILFCSFHKKKTNLSSCYSVTYNLLKNAFEMPKLLMESIGRNQYLDDTYEFKPYFSPTKRKIALIRIIRKEDFDPATLHIGIFDNNFEKIEDFQLDMPVAGHKIKYRKPVILENGDIYFETEEVHYGKNKHSIKDDRKYRRVYSVKTNTKEVQGSNLVLEGKRLLLSKIYLNKLGKPEIVGYYRDGDKWGVFQKGLENPDEDIKLDMFSGDRAKTAYTKDGFVGHGNDFSVMQKYSPRGHFVRKVIHGQDDVFYMISEAYSVNSGFRSEEIFISMINAEGMIEWTSIIDKYQITSSAFEGSDFSFSFSHYMDAEFLYIMFNDSKKKYNEAGKLLDKIEWADHMRNQPILGAELSVIAKIDLLTGTTVHTVFHDNRSDNLYFNPRSLFVDEDTGRLFFYCKRSINSNKGKFGRFTID